VVTFRKMEMFCLKATMWRRQKCEVGIILDNYMVLVLFVTVSVQHLFVPLEALPLGAYTSVPMFHTLGSFHLIYS